MDYFEKEDLHYEELPSTTMEIEDLINFGIRASFKGPSGKGLVGRSAYIAQLVAYFLATIESFELILKNETNEDIIEDVLRPLRKANRLYIRHSSVKEDFNQDF